MQVKTTHLCHAKEKSTTPIPVGHAQESEGTAEYRSVHGAGVREDCDGAHHHTGEPEGEDACNSAETCCGKCVGAGVPEVGTFVTSYDLQHYGLTSLSLKGTEK